MSFAASLADQATGPALANGFVHMAVLQGQAGGPGAAAGGGEGPAFRSAFHCPGGDSPSPRRRSKAARARNSDRFKTRMCHYVLRGKPCPQGRGCSFAHSDAELRRAPRGGAGTALHLGGRKQVQPAAQCFKTRMCVHWLKSDGQWCPLGTRCRFAHGEEEVQAGGRAPAAVSVAQRMLQVPVQYHATPATPCWAVAAPSSASPSSTGGSSVHGPGGAAHGDTPFPTPWLPLTGPGTGLPSYSLGTGLPGFVHLGGATEGDGWEPGSAEGRSQVAATLQSLGIPLHEGERGPSEETPVLPTG